ncbi:MAG: glycosyltransferase 87 family protein [Bacteroidia bacterium]
MPGKKSIPAIIAVALSALLYFILLFHTPRQNFYQLIGLFAALSGLYIYLVWYASREGIALVLIAAIFFRQIPFFSLDSLPALSDDFFRFVWDGRLMVGGVNPFSALPESYINNPELATNLHLTPELFTGLNSKTYFTIYPPVLQGIFYLASFIFPQSLPGAVQVMRLFIVLAEAGSIYLMILLLRRFQQDDWQIALYALNPLVIVELTGNLHFEALMIFFLLWALWLLVEGKWIGSSLPFALAVGSKLLPLMLLPLLIRRLGWQKTMIYGFLVAAFTGVLFIPFFDRETFINLSRSIDLYFHKFEFNASLYYLIRWVGYRFTGYNVIQIIGKYLAMVSALAILIYSYREKSPGWKNLPESFVWVFLFYFSLTSIVHPWYVTSLVAFSVFSRLRFPIAWSFVVMLSYYTYRTTAYEENLWLAALEYVIVAIWIFFEVREQRFVKKDTL